MNPPTATSWESLRTRGVFKLKPETRRPYVLVCLVLWSTLSFLIISRYLVSSVEIDGVSMENTLHNHKRYLVNRLVYKLRDPNRGEMAVLRDHLDDSYVVKRIIGLPGELIEFKRGRVLINGTYLDEPYLVPGTETWPMKASLKAYQIPRDHYFVLGDNRANSTDSRIYGVLDRDSIFGLILP